MQAILFIGLLQFFKSDANFIGQVKTRSARNIHFVIFNGEFSIRF